jgi:hypothetical protein
VAAFVAAAQAGDVEAALAMIDPQVRPLIAIEVLLEEYMIEMFTLRDWVMTKEQRQFSFNNFGAIPAVYAKQDMLRIREIDVRDERPSMVEGAGDGEDERVLLDVDWRVRPWYATDRNESDGISVTMLAVRRDDRWYLFHPFGAVNRALGASVGSAEEGESVLFAEREKAEEGDSVRTVFRLTYQVPIEVVDEELAEAAQSDEAEDLLVQGREMARFIRTLRYRVMRGDFADIKELDAALADPDDVLESLVIRHGELYLQAVRALDGKLPEPAAEPE